MSINGGFYNPFGSLPYGYDPSSQSSVINTGGLWADDNTVWNLNDRMLVQNLPQTQSLMNSILGNNTGMYGNYGYNTMPGSSIGAMGGFYNNLIAQNEANLAMLRSSSGGSNSMNDMMQMLMFMKQMDAVEKAEKKHNAPEKKEKEFDRDEVSQFVKNKNKDSILKYGSLKTFAAENYEALKDTNTHVTVSAALKQLGIDPDDLSDEAAKKLYGDSLADDRSNQSTIIFGKDDAAGLKNYKSFLKDLGFKDSANAISRGGLQKGLDSLSEGKEADESTSSESSEELVDSIKLLVDQDEPNSGTIDDLTEKIEEISKDKDALKLFLTSDIASQHGGKKSLSSVYAALYEVDDDSANDKFKQALLKLKNAAKKHKLKDEWNAAADAAKGDSIRGVDGADRRKYESALTSFKLS